MIFMRENSIGKWQQRPWDKKCQQNPAKYMDTWIYVYIYISNIQIYFEDIYIFMTGELRLNISINTM